MLPYGVFQYSLRYIEEIDVSFVKKKRYCMYVCVCVCVCVQRTVLFYILQYYTLYTPPAMFAVISSDIF